MMAKIKYSLVVQFFVLFILGQNFVKSHWTYSNNGPSNFYYPQTLSTNQKLPILTKQYTPTTQGASQNYPYQGPANTYQQVPNQPHSYSQGEIPPSVVNDPYTARRSHNQQQSNSYAPVPYTGVPVSNHGQQQANHPYVKVPFYGTQSRGQSQQANNPYRQVSPGTPVGVYNQEASQPYGQVPYGTNNQQQQTNNPYGHNSYFGEPGHGQNTQPEHFYDPNSYKNVQSGQVLSPNAAGLYTMSGSRSKKKKKSGKYEVSPEQLELGCSGKKGCKESCEKIIDSGAFEDREENLVSHMTMGCLDSNDECDCHETGGVFKTNQKKDKQESITPEQAKTACSGSEGCQDVCDQLKEAGAFKKKVKDFVSRMELKCSDDEVCECTEKDGGKFGGSKDKRKRKDKDKSE